MRKQRHKRTNIGNKATAHHSLVVLAEQDSKIKLILNSDDIKLQIFFCILIANIQNTD